MPCNSCSRTRVNLHPYITPSRRAGMHPRAGYDPYLLAPSERRYPPEYNNNGGVNPGINAAVCPPGGCINPYTQQPYPHPPSGWTAPPLYIPGR